jgi:hypothetical protein
MPGRPRHFWERSGRLLCAVAPFAGRRASGFAVRANDSDRAIARALLINPKTAGVHVGNILDKLGVPSRAAAVAYAHRHGLAYTTHGVSHP